MHSIDINEDKDTTEWLSTSQVFPIIFPNGCRVEPHEFHCSVCELPIAHNTIKHHIVRMHQGHTAVIRMKGYCKRCQHTLEHHHRIKCYGKTVYFEFMHGGQWVSVLPRKSVWRSIMRWVELVVWREKKRT